MKKRTPAILIWSAFFMLAGGACLFSETQVFGAMQAKERNFSEYLHKYQAKQTAKRQKINDPKLLAEFDQKSIEVKAMEQEVNNRLSLNILSCFLYGVLFFTGLFSLLTAKNIFFLEKWAPQAAKIASIFIAISTVFLVNWIAWVMGFLVDYIIFSEKILHAESGFNEISDTSQLGQAGSPNSHFLPFANLVVFALSIVLLTIVFFYFSRSKVREKFV